MNKPAPETLDYLVSHQLARWRPVILANRAVPYVLALTAWLSLAPYFVWGRSWVLILGGLVAAAVAVVVLVAEPRVWDRLEMAGVALLTLFLILITLETKVDGGHIRWVFVLPTLLALGLLSQDQRRVCLNFFTDIFVVSLVPALLVDFYLAAGLPVNFASFVGSDGTKRLLLPGLVFIEANRIDLPWGGVLFRMCGIYDEPGMVGTVGALLLATLQFRFKHWRAVIMYVAGALSFSLAFAVLATIGVLARAILVRKLQLALGALPIVATIALALGWWNIGTRPDGMTNVSVTQSPSSTQKLDPVGNVLRQRTILDRSTNAMDQLLHEYQHSSIATLLFGIASDASVVRGARSQIWTRILTDHGLIGLLLLGCGAGLIGLSALRFTAWSPWAFLFLALYTMSAYQRPVIWMPYTLLILFCAGSLLQQSKPGRPRS